VELETEPNYFMADVTFQTSSLLRHSASAASTACFVVSESIEEAVNCILYVEMCDGNTKAESGGKRGIDSYSSLRKDKIENKNSLNAVDDNDDEDDDDDDYCIGNKSLLA